MLIDSESKMRELSERIRVLEVRFRRLRWFLPGGTAAIALVVVLTLAAGSSSAVSDPTGDNTTTSKLVRTEALEIVDPDSRARIKLSAKYQKPGISIDDERGKERISLGLSPAGASAPDKTPGLWLYDSKDNLSICVRSDDEPFIILRDDHDRNRIRLSVWQKTNPMIEILDSQGEKAVWKAP